MSDAQNPATVEGARCEAQVARWLPASMEWDRCSRPATTKRRDHGYAVMRPVCTQHAHCADRGTVMFGGGVAP